MIIRNEEELKGFISTLPQEIIEHIAFKENIINKLSNCLTDGYTINAELSADKKSISFITNAKVIKDGVEPKSIISGLELSVDQGGNLRCTETYGELTEAATYYARREKGKRASSNDSILGVSYNHTIYDKNGIITGYGTFTKSGSLIQTRYENVYDLKTEAFSKGQHMPKEWYLDGTPKAPERLNGATISVRSRNVKNPSIARIEFFEYGEDGILKSNEKYLGRVHGEYPDKLRVDEEDIFAKLRNSNWELTETVKESHPDMNTDDVIKEISMQFPEVLENSKTRTNSANKYIVLMDMANEVNKKYEEKELEAGIQM